MKTPCLRNAVDYLPNDASSYPERSASSDLVRLRQWTGRDGPSSKVVSWNALWVTAAPLPLTAKVSRCGIFLRT